MPFLSGLIFRFDKLFRISLIDSIFELFFVTWGDIWTLNKLSLFDFVWDKRKFLASLSNILFQRRHFFISTKQFFVDHIRLPEPSSFSFYKNFRNIIKLNNIIILLLLLCKEFRWHIKLLHHRVNFRFKVCQKRVFFWLKDFLTKWKIVLRVSDFILNLKRWISDLTIYVDILLLHREFPEHLHLLPLFRR